MQKQITVYCLCIKQTSLAFSLLPAGQAARSLSTVGTDPSVLAAGGEDDTSAKVSRGNVLAVLLMAQQRTFDVGLGEEEEGMP